MKENRISTTITHGRGSEKHNHDLEYREGLPHVHGGGEIIELIPYRSYKEQINEMMEPYIQEYNERQEKSYSEKMERFNSGELKSRPKKADFKPMGFDYYSDNKNKTYYNKKKNSKEELLLFRSMIFGIGDQADKLSGKISQEQAVQIFSNIIKDWPEMFPNFHLLGATVHLDEEGFYHCHVDYFPLSEKEITKRGLSVSVSEDHALEKMGFKPEQSLINGRDKVPILFNAMRNKLYLKFEEELNACGLRLVYGISKEKAPGKDSSKRQDLTDWQKTQDKAFEIQELKNQLLDGVDEKIDSERIPEIMENITNISQSLETVDNLRGSRIVKGSNIKIEYNLFDQLKSFVESVMETIGKIYSKLFEVEKERDELKRELRETKQDRKEIIQDLNAVRFERDEIKKDLSESQNENRNLKRENALRKTLMTQAYNKDGTSLEDNYKKQMKWQELERDDFGRSR